jgi:hypothetical protein
LTPVAIGISTHDLLIRHGYKLIDDAWNESGRLTYHHNDDATREFMTGLEKVLRSAGWEAHPNMLRAFHHPESNEIIEIEPGGSETNGHFLHLEAVR